MKPFILLISVFLLTVIAWAIIDPPADFIFAGNLAMAVMLLFTSIGHFKFSTGMMMMIPGNIPFKREIIYLTGIVEIIAGIALMIPKAREYAAIFLIGFFIIILPANIYAAKNNIDFEKGTKEGPGLKYLWFRLPLQIFFIVWVWYFSLRSPTPAP